MPGRPRAPQGTAAVTKGALKHRPHHDSDSPVKFHSGKHFSSDMQSQHHEVGTEADMQLQRPAVTVTLGPTDFQLRPITQHQLNPSVTPNETDSIEPPDDSARMDGSSVTVDEGQPLTVPHQNHASTMFVASPQTSPLTGSTETDNADSARDAEGDMVSSPPCQENEKSCLIESEDAPELVEVQTDSTQASTWSTPWSRHLLGLDAFGRSYWPGNSPQINVFFTRSNWPGDQFPWGGGQWGSPVPPVFLAPEDSSAYLYGQLLRERSSSLGNGKKRSTACLGAFIFMVSMFCVWMFYLVGEYRAEPLVAPAPGTFHGSQPEPFERSNGVDVSGARVPIDEARAAEFGRAVEPLLSYDNTADMTSARNRKGRPDGGTDVGGVAHRPDTIEGASNPEQH